MWFAQPHIGLHNPTGEDPTSIALSIARVAPIHREGLPPTPRVQQQAAAA